MALAGAGRAAVIPVYQLSKDERGIQSAQRATLSTLRLGYARTHGLFGSDEWWQKIKLGKLRTFRIAGTIVKLREGCWHGPEVFVMLGEDGKETTWLRYANTRELNELYAEGKRVEIDYVFQRLRFFSIVSCLKKLKVPIEIRVEESSPSA